MVLIIYFYCKVPILTSKPQDLKQSVTGHFSELLYEFVSFIFDFLLKRIKLNFLIVNSIQPITFIAKKLISQYFLSKYNHKMINKLIDWIFFIFRSFLPNCFSRKWHSGGLSKMVMIAKTLIFPFQLFDFKLPDLFL